MQYQHTCYGFRNAKESILLVHYVHSILGPPLRPSLQCEVRVKWQTPGRLAASSTLFGLSGSMCAYFHHRVQCCLPLSLFEQFSFEAPFLRLAFAVVPTASCVTLTPCSTRASRRLARRKHRLRRCGVRPGEVVEVEDGEGGVINRDLKNA